MIYVTRGTHTRTQVQIDAVTKHLTKRFAKNVPPEFGGTFEYVKVFLQYSESCQLPIKSLYK